MRTTEGGAVVAVERLLDAARVLTGASYIALRPEPAPGAGADGLLAVSVGSLEGHRATPSVVERPVAVNGRVVARLHLATPAVPMPGVVEAVEALAAVTALVLASDRTEGRSEQRLRWLEASARLTEVFAPPLDLGAAFREVAGLAQALSGATGVALVRHKGTVVRPLAVAGQPWSAFEPLLDRTRWRQTEGVAAGPELLRLNARPDAPRLLAVAPMRSEVKGAAALLATFQDSPAPEVAGLLCAFAGQAAFAFDRAQAGDSDATLAVLGERERLARDLHDQVMQRLFGIGLQVQVARDQVAEPAVRAHLDEVADELDRTLTAIRSTVSALRTGEPPTSEES